jgi:hypothetical protein
LIAAPTGSGKTLAAFLTALDDLVQEGLRAPLPDEVRVVYVSPLKALSADIHKNLAEPRRGIVRLAEAAGLEPPRITAAVRTGDTTSSERAAMLRTPPHILVTTPESLYLLLTAERSREMLRTARTIIVDEIHAVIGTRRGAHLALSLERLQQVAGQPLLRIGLSATQKPIEEVGRFLVGIRDPQSGLREPQAALSLPKGAIRNPQSIAVCAVSAASGTTRSSSWAWPIPPSTRISGMSARKVCLLAAVCGTLTIEALAQAPAPPDIDALLARVAERIEVYYKRAQNIMCTEKTIVLPIGHNWESAGMHRITEAELRVEAEGLSDGSGPPGPTFFRQLLKINGREPRV